MDVEWSGKRGTGAPHQPGNQPHNELLLPLKRGDLFLDSVPAVRGRSRRRFGLLLAGLGSLEFALFRHQLKWDDCVGQGQTRRGEAGWRGVARASGQLAVWTWEQNAQEGKKTKEEEGEEEERCEEGHRETEGVSSMVGTGH